MTRPVNLDTLPEALGRELCTFVDPGTATQLSRVNREMQRVVQNSWASIARHFITGHFQSQLHPWIPPVEQLERLRVAESSHASIVLKMTLREWCAEGCLKISKDGKKALFSGCSKGIRLWDLTRGKCILRLGQDQYYKNLHMSGDGKRAFATTTKVFEGVEKKTLTVWDLERGEMLQEIPLGNKTHSHSQLMVNDDGKKALYFVDNVLSLFDLDTGIEVHRVPTDMEHVEIGCNGERALGCVHGGLKIWDLTEATARCIYTSEGEEDVVILSHDGERALVQREENLVWLDLFSGSIIRESLILKSNEPVRTFAMNANETRAVFSQAYNLQHWDLTTGERLHTLLDGRESRDMLPVISFIRINPNGTRAISLTAPITTSEDRVLRLWDLQTGACLQTIRDSEHLGGISMEMDAYGMTALNPSYGHITVWNFAPLPEERISAVAETFRRHSPAAAEEFKQLPGFVQNAIARPAKPSLAVRFMEKLAATSPARRLMNLGGYLGDLKPLARVREGLHYYTDLASNEMARNIDTHIVGSRVLPVIAGIFDQADRSLVPLIRRLPPLFTRHIYGFLDPVSREALMLTNEEAAGRLSTANMITEDAQARFLTLPENIKQLVYAEVIRQRAIAGTLPEDAPDNYGELSFYNIGDYSTTPAEKSAAIMAVWNRLRTNPRQ